MGNYLCLFEIFDITANVILILYLACVSRGFLLNTNEISARCNDYHFITIEDDSVRYFLPFLPPPQNLLSDYLFFESISYLNHRKEKEAIDAQTDKCMA